MKKIFIILIAILFSKSANAQLVNEGFELTAPGSYTTANAVSGWTVESRKNNGTCTYTNWTAGSPEFSIVATPLTNWPTSTSPISLIPHSPLGGTVVAQLNNATPDTIMTCIKQTFVVNSWNTLLYFAFAGYWERAIGQNCCQGSGFRVKLYDCNGTVIACPSLSLIPGSGCQSAGVQYSLTSQGHMWSNWQVRTYDLSQYVGSCVTIEINSNDCAYGTNFGTALIDVKTGAVINSNPLPLDGYTVNPVGSYLPVSFCPGLNWAHIYGPPGYLSYQWIAPGNVTVSPPQGTMSILQVLNPIPGSVYTLTAYSPYGCLYAKTYTLVASTSSIAATAVHGACLNTATGSATVIAVGHPAGYTYTWVNSSNSVVSTQSVATGLAQGLYTVTLGNIGICGNAWGTHTVLIPARTFSPAMVLQPYCGTEAILNTPPGSSAVQWYNGTTPITGTAGTAPSYTVFNTCNGCFFWAGYDNSAGCRDSVKYTLNTISPGNLAVPNLSINPGCFSANDGTAAITMTPALSNYSVLSSYFVAGTGTNSAYTASLGPTSSSIFALTGLSAGTYSVNTFDGLCKYNTTFTINPYTFSYSLSATNATVCAGSNTPVSVNFSSTPGPGQYTYSWSPTSWLWGGNGTFSATIINPTAIPAGSVSTTIYTIVVTPTIANCPLSATMAITAANPTVQSIAVPGQLCDNFPSQTVSVSPVGGTFINAVQTPNLVHSTTGAFSPSNAVTGTNTFTYVTNIGACLASKSASFSVSKFNTAQLTNSLQPLCINQGSLNLTALVQNSTGIWSGPGVQSNTFNIGTLLSNTFLLTYHTQSAPTPLLCPDSSFLLITIIPLPTITVPSGTVCSAQNYTIVPTGAFTYSYSSGSAVVNPTTTTSYSVWGKSEEGCESEVAAALTVTAIPLPSLEVSSSSSLICAGETAILTANGASTYSWSHGPDTFSAAVNPTTSTIYFVTGTLSVCSATAYFLQEVSPCAFLSDQTDKSRFLVFPNPFSDVIYLQTNGTSQNSSLELTDNSGRVLVQMPLKSELNTIHLGQLPKGLYHLRVKNKDNGVRTMRMIKQ